MYIGVLKINKIYFLFLILLSFLFLIPFIFLVEAEHLSNFLILILGLFMVGTIYLLTIFSGQNYLFEPLHLVTLIYILEFSISPIIDTINGNTSLFGINVFGSLGKSTLIYVISYFSFIFGYLSNSFSKKFSWNNQNIKVRESINFKVFVSFLFWMVSFSNAIALFYTKGSVVYFLTLGLINTGKINLVQADVGFLYMLTYIMIAPWLYLTVLLPLRKIFKIILTCLTFITFFSLGFRYIFLVMFIAPLIFHAKSNRRFNKLFIIKLIIILLILLIFFALLGSIRGSLKRFERIKYTGSLFDSIIQVFISNLNDTYKAFYALVENYPDNYNYTFGKQMSYTFIYVIPRILYKSKPLPEIKNVLYNSLGKVGLTSGVAWPNIGEYYVEFGILGVIIFMYLFGYFSKIIFLRYYFYTNSYDDIIFYSMFYPLLIQIIMRGYTPSNFWFLLFLYLITRIMHRI
ncbi:O-antigen polymerase [Thermosipho sp. 1070]|uniref:O-antigen polymerase n=1 Tax=Thermosipho sp. 1070 TaxID=1437364 RepID=UPI0009493D93|nr:O-antigen polymerase [Thermosipho sp. 1070]ANQ54611.1 hypothetical protein Y592_04230 [Thermosipho sp. 1070]